MNLKEEIKRSRWRTQERFALECGINETTLSKYVRGVKIPSTEHLRKITRALKDDKRDNC